VQFEFFLNKLKTKLLVGCELVILTVNITYIMFFFRNETKISGINRMYVK